MKKLIVLLGLLAFPLGASAQQACDSQLMGLGMASGLARSICGYDTLRLRGAYFTDDTARADITYSSNTLLFRTTTANNIEFGINSSSVLQITSAGLLPKSDGVNSLGTSSTGFLNVYGENIFAGTKLTVPSGTDLPATCAVGEIFVDTDDNACLDAGSGSGATCVCQATNTWAEVS